MYYDGEAWTKIAVGSSGDVLTVSAEGIPAWESP